MKTLDPKTARRTVDLLERYGLLTDYVEVEDDKGNSGDVPATRIAFNLLAYGHEHDPAKPRAITPAKPPGRTKRGKKGRAE